jgi:VCBS repeat-containing protein
MFRWLRTHVLDALDVKPRNPRRQHRRWPAIETLEDRNAPDNLAPLANHDVYSLDEDTSINVPMPGVLANDSDPDNDPLTAVLVQGPEYGDLTFNADGSFIYTPPPDFNGEVTFTYKAFDGLDYSDLATVTLTVNGLNDAPVSIGDDVLTDLNIPITFAPMQNDFDVDGNSLNIVSFTPPSHGTVEQNQDQTFTYTPTTGQSADDSFTYTIGDGSGLTSTATVNITVGPAFNDDVTTEEDTAVTIDVLANDAGQPGTNTITGASGAQHGSLAVNPNNTVSYTPTANWYGQDTFSYTMQDGAGVTDTAQVQVTVVWTDDAPVSLDDQTQTQEDTSVPFNILTNDTDIDQDQLQVVELSQGTNGSVEYNGGGSLTYTPNSDFTGQDLVTYTVSDGYGGVDSATLTITVQATNDAPLAFNDGYSFGYDPDFPAPTFPINGVLYNDTDWDIVHGSNEQISISTWDTTGLAGSLTYDASTASFQFTPVQGFFGRTSFTYILTDGTLTSNTDTVYIYVEPMLHIPGGGDPPPELATVNDEYYVGDDPLSANVKNNDIGVDIVVLDGPPPNVGHLTPFQINGDFTYTPDSNLGGEEWIAYRAFASDGRNVPGTLTLSEPEPWLQGYSLAVEVKPRDPLGKFQDIALNSKPGLFVHWNIDNDNGNVQAGNDLLGRPLVDGQGQPAAPKPDFKDAGSVSNEDDLLPLLATVQNVGHEGTITLKRDNANVRVWRTKTKGGASTEILVNNDEKVWNLANQVEYDDFFSLWPTSPPTQYYNDAKLWVEGYGDAKGGDGKSNLNLRYTPPPGKGASTSRSINYTFFGAGTGRQPTPLERDSIKASWPKLIDCEWSITDEPTLAPPGFANPANLPPGTNPQPRQDRKFYNCFAWTIGEERKWWDDQPLPLDPQEAAWFRVMANGDREITDAEMKKFYKDQKGWQSIGRPTDEAEAITFWGRSQFGVLNNSHGARNMYRKTADGNLALFESKLGIWWRIEHVWDQLEGGAYGDMHLFFK